MFRTVTLNRIWRKWELTLELQFSDVRLSGLSLRFRGKTDYPCGLFLHVCPIICGVRVPIAYSNWVGLAPSIADLTVDFRV